MSVLGFFFWIVNEAEHYVIIGIWASLIFFILFLCIWVFCLHVSAHRDEKKVFDLLVLKLQTIERHHVGTINKSRTPGKAVSGALNL